jgi:predicted transcriptional regulator YdeE
MIFEKMHIEGFKVIGISTRTKNSDEMVGKGKIKKLWQDFFSGKVKEKVLGKTSEDIVAVYYGYESDAHGPYNLLLGFKVNENVQPPDGMTAVNIPPQECGVFTSDHGEVHEIIFKTWKNIWDLTEKKEIERKFTYDFELYGERAANPKSAQVEIFISVR